MSEIGLRAARAIREMAAEYDTSVTFELNCLKLNLTKLYHYEHGNFDPSASALASMAKNGYDVHYILTGEKHEHRKKSR